MAEQPAELQRINWSRCFAFTQIFKTFKMALHPGKLGLALAAIILTGLWGWALDKTWMRNHRPLTDEVSVFWQWPDIDQWRGETLKAAPTLVAGQFEDLGERLKHETQLELSNSPTTGVSTALRELKERYYAAASRAQDREAATQTAARYTAAYRRISRLRTEGVFSSFLKYETSCLRQMIDSAATLKLTGGTHEVLRARRGQWAADAAPGSLDPPRLIEPAHTGFGVLPSMILMVRGVQWLITEHPLFAILFGLGKLAIWALFGGAICRMAALNYARDERIPLKSALAFARRKYLGFATAPLLPLGMIFGIGVLLWLGGFVGKMPYLGEIIVGLGLVLALLGGFVIALVLIGFLGGGSLMWPTIAVEGSDSFDAMSRSYSYVYTRPWKAAFYAIVALVYGAICYLFARFFVWVALRATRAFVAAGLGWWPWRTARPGTGIPGADKMDAMWPIPTFDSLWYPPPPFGYEHWDRLGMVLVTIWVMLVVLSLCAFLASFYFSASTIIYFLLRREVDSTDLEDVDTEEQGEEEAAVAPTGTAVAPEPEAGTGPEPQPST